MTNPVHHIELWTTDLQRTGASFDWLLTRIGWHEDVDAAWPEGRVWRCAGAPYIVLEQSPAVNGPHDRMRAGLNHLALRAPDRGTLDRLREDCQVNGWHELFADRYPHAGGRQHTALFIENDEGFECEIVVDTPD
ncbi:VOC family protein [Flexivirga endophytica]|nr:VOC family protein [Flexivirga endophytica]